MFSLSPVTHEDRGESYDVWELGNTKLGRKSKKKKKKRKSMLVNSGSVSVDCDMSDRNLWQKADKGLGKDLSALYGEKCPNTPIVKL